jgi:uncharacterized membrane protein YgdD (TMEM256/DUF423 family)
MTATEEYAVSAEHDHRADTRGANLTELFSGILSDVQTLVKQQVGLIRAEFLEDLRRTKRVAQCLAIGAIFLVVGTIMILVAGVYLVQYLTGWPEWAAWASVGGTSILIGAISVIVGSRILTTYNPLPDKSLHALQENVSCLTNPQK